MDEALPHDFAYSEYMIWMKPPPTPDYAYYEYIIWMKLNPMTLPILNI
jgi:hypothetical protein